LSIATPSARIGSGEPHCNAQINEEMHALGLPYFDMFQLRARYCAESLAAGERALVNANAIEGVPLLIIHDPADKYTDPVGSDMLHARLPASSTLLPARGAGHDVVSGDTEGVFIAAVVAFFAKAFDGGNAEAVAKAAGEEKKAAA
jgi:pimeloyl-ACP methyl ester carboxylesterase